MYIPTHHEQNNCIAALALVDTYPLGAWVVPGRNGLTANHIPFVLDRRNGKYGTLIGHVARANHVWKQLPASESSVVLFQGPQTYISPGWYPGKKEHGKVVPTWNYAVVHAHGIARVIQDEASLRDMLSQLTAAQESTQPVPWRVSDAPEQYITKLLGAIVGIEIPIDKLEAKWKVSQDEAIQDRLATVIGLKAKGDLNALQMASLVEQAIHQNNDT